MEFLAESEHHSSITNHALPSPTTAKTSGLPVVVLGRRRAAAVAAAKAVFARALLLVRVMSEVRFTTVAALGRRSMIPWEIGPVFMLGTGAVWVVPLVRHQRANHVPQFFDLPGKTLHLGTEFVVASSAGAVGSAVLMRGLTGRSLFAMAGRLRPVRVTLWMLSLRLIRLGLSTAAVGRHHFFHRLPHALRHLAKSGSLEVLHGFADVFGALLRVHVLRGMVSPGVMLAESFGHFAKAVAAILLLASTGLRRPARIR